MPTSAPLNAPPFSLMETLLPAPAIRKHCLLSAVGARRAACTPSANHCGSRPLVRTDLGRRLALVRDAWRDAEAHGNDADNLLPRHSLLDVLAAERAADPPRVQPERLRKKASSLRLRSRGPRQAPGPVAAGQHKIVAHAFGEEQLGAPGSADSSPHLQRNRQPKRSLFARTRSLSCEISSGESGSDANFRTV